MPPHFFLIPPRAEGHGAGSVLRARGQEARAAPCPPFPPSLTVFQRDGKKNTSSRWQTRPRVSVPREQGDPLPTPSGGRRRSVTAHAALEPLEGRGAQTSSDARVLGETTNGPQLRTRGRSRALSLTSDAAVQLGSRSSSPTVPRKVWGQTEGHCLACGLKLVSPALAHLPAMLSEGPG